MNKAKKSPKRSVLYTGSEADDAPFVGVPGAKADGTPKTVLDMTMYDDVDTLMDQTLLHFSKGLDAEGIERAIHDEYEVVKGDLRAFIGHCIALYTQDGTTPEDVRAVLESSPFRFWLRVMVPIYARPVLTGIIAGGSGTLLLGKGAEQVLPPFLWAIRYALLVLLLFGAHFTLRCIEQRYGSSSFMLITSAIAGALAAFLLLKGL